MTPSSRCAPPPAPQAFFSFRSDPLDSRLSSLSLSFRGPSTLAHSFLGTRMLFKTRVPDGRSHGLVKLQKRSNQHDPRTPPIIARLGISWGQFQHAPAKYHGWGVIEGCQKSHERIQEAVCSKLATRLGSTRNWLGDGGCRMPGGG